MATAKESYFRKHSIDMTVPKDMEGPRVFSTGNHYLDWEILGLGGFARGVCIELFGREQSGKSTVLYHAIGNAQKAGFKCAVLDTEGRIVQPEVQEWAEKAGMVFDPEMLMFAYEVGPAENLILGLIEEMDAEQYGIIAIDSLACLQTENEIKGIFTDPTGASKVAALATVLKRMMPQLARKAWEKNVAIICTNQMREVIDAVRSGPPGAQPSKVKVAARGDERTPGGRMWRHAATQRLFFQRIDGIWDDADTKHEGQVIGTLAEAVLVKSAISPPLKRTGVKGVPHINFYFDGRLMDEVACLMDYSVRLGVVEKNGSFYTLPDANGTIGKGQKLQGEAKFRAACEQPEFLTWLRNAVFANSQVSAPSASALAAAADEGVVITE